MLAFDQFYLMTGGRPRRQTFTSVFRIYQNSFVYLSSATARAVDHPVLIILCGSALQIAVAAAGRSSVTRHRLPFP